MEIKITVPVSTVTVDTGKIADSIASIRDLIELRRVWSGLFHAMVETFYIMREKASGDEYTKLRRAANGY